MFVGRGGERTSWSTTCLQARDGFVKETDAETGAALQTLRTGSHAFCSARFCTSPRCRSSSPPCSFASCPGALSLGPLAWPGPIHRSSLELEGEQGRPPSLTQCCLISLQPMFTFTPDESRTEKLKFGMCMAVDVVDVEGKPLIVTAYENGSLYWWDPRTQRILFQLPQVFPEPILAFQLDQKGTKGVLGGAEESLVHFSVDYAASAASVTSRTALAQRGVDAIALRHDEVALPSHPSSSHPLLRLSSPRPAGITACASTPGATGVPWPSSSITLRESAPFSSGASPT